MGLKSLVSILRKGLYELRSHLGDLAIVPAQTICGERLRYFIRREQFPNWIVNTRAKKMQFMGLWYAREVNLSPDMCRALRTVWRKL